jgi:hypothetical protein
LLPYRSFSSPFILIHFSISCPAYIKNLTGMFVQGLDMCSPMTIILFLTTKARSFFSLPEMIAARVMISISSGVQGVPSRAEYNSAAFSGSSKKILNTPSLISLLANAMISAEILFLDFSLLTSS